MGKEIKFTMHSHERTLLSSLGFADSDKKDTRHDMAIQYLMDVDRAKALVNHRTKIIAQRDRWKEVKIDKASPESHVTKGEGKYQTTVGFADLIVWFTAHYEYDVAKEVREDVDPPAGGGPYVPFRMVLRKTGETATSYKNQFLLVEVKIHPIPVGDIARQMALYQEHTREWTYWGGYGIVATAFDLSVEDVNMLECKGIWHIRLGAKFDAYCAERRESPQTASSVEI